MSEPPIFEVEYIDLPMAPVEPLPEELSSSRLKHSLLVLGGIVLVVVAAIVWRPAALLGLGALPFAVPPVRAVRGGAAGRDLVPVLGATGRLQLAFGVLTTIGLALGA